MPTASNRSALQSYGRLVSHLWPHRWVALGALVSSGILAATQGAYAWLVGPVLRFVYDRHASERFQGVIPVSLSVALETAGGIASLLAAAVLSVSFVRAFAQFGSHYLIALAGQRVVRALRAKLYAHVLRLPLRYF